MIMENNTINKIGALIFAIVLFIVFYIGFGVYRENRIRLVEGDVQTNIDGQDNVINEVTVENEATKISESYLGFDVSAQLIIPKIDLQTYILSDYKEDGMKVCASKFWGPNPNEVGNFCIAGHNYEKENMFNHLIDLQVGDELYLADNRNGKVLYRIFDIYKVKPDNVKPLSQETGGKVVVTLITCVNYSKNRLIVQAVAEG